MKIIVFANSFYNLGGGEKIFVEYSKRWIEFGETVKIVTNEEGKQFCIENGLKSEYLTLWPSSWSDKFGISISTIYKSLISLFRSFFISTKNIDAIFAASFISVFHRVIFSKLFFLAQAIPFLTKAEATPFLR